MKIGAGVLGVLLLAGCSWTNIDVSYDDGTGKVVTASYFSTKDIEAPTFEAERDEAGRIQRITLSAANSLASPVAAQNAQLIAAIIAGVLQGASPFLAREGVPERRATQ